jgi:MSHA biogenesis protein MshL
MTGIMRGAACVVACGLLSGCAGPAFKSDDVLETARAEIAQAAQPKAVPAKPAEVEQALVPPLVVEMPSVGKRLEPSFDLVVNNAPAAQVFAAMVSGTRYSILVHPEVKDIVSVSLKDITVPEALNAMRELYGFEFKLDGTRIYVQPRGLRTQIFHVNYLLGRREGRADVRVASGSIQSPGFTAPGLPGSTTAPAATNATPGASTGQAVESSRVTTSSVNDYWRDLQAALNAIVGDGKGRSVIINAQSGVIVVRAMPEEMRDVVSFLKKMQAVVERQVMLEAKILEVQLSDGYQTGINWSAFRNGGNTRVSGGVAQPGTVLSTTGPLISGASGITFDAAGNITSATSPSIGAVAGTSLVNFPTGPAGLFGLAFQTSNFAALINFLETQGGVQVLSSPRIATLNNQKAVLKVGTDEFFVTNVSTTTSSTGSTSTVSPTITVQPFFSGIALDVTPQIADDGQIILHIHPSVSVVSDKTKTLNLGELGVITLPLASSNVNESDTIVRVSDGSIVAIGGLMKQNQTADNASLPGLGDVPGLGALFSNKRKSLLKSELVILLKTTVIRGEQTWQSQAREVDERVRGMTRPPRPTADAP